MSSSTNEPQSQEAPHFFGSNSEFENKAELAESGRKFCIMDVSDTETMYGQKWFVQVFEEGAEEFSTITFAHGSEQSKREQDLLALSQHPEYLPVHSCTLKKYNFEGKQGYRIVARSGGGPCPCTPAQPKGSHEPFAPDEWDVDEVMGAQPAAKPDPTVQEALAAAVPSGTQMMKLGQLSIQLARDVQVPSSYAEAQKLIEALEHDLARTNAGLNKRTTHVEKGVPLR